jgi:excisionase family DNA binding protein
MNAAEGGLQTLPANCPATTAASGVTIGKMFLTVAEAAARLGMTPSWIYERTRRKAIPHRKLGKFVRFTEQDLQAIADAAATGTLQ